MSETTSGAWTADDLSGLLRQALAETWTVEKFQEALGGRRVTIVMFSEACIHFEGSECFSLLHYIRGIDFLDDLETSDTPEDMASTAANTSPEPETPPSPAAQVVARYLTTTRPVEADIHVALGETPLGDTEALALVSWLARAGHSTVMERVLRGITDPQQAGVAMLQGLRASHDVAHGIPGWSWAGLLTRARPDWAQEMVLPGSDGWSVWEHALVSTWLCNDDDARFNLMDGILALPDTLVLAPHRVHAGLRCVDVWTWLWLRMRTSSRHLQILDRLLCRGANPNMAMPTPGGLMSLGSGLLLGTRQAWMPERWVPASELPALPDKTWVRREGLTMPEFSLSWVLAGLHLLVRAGMRMDTLTIASPWREPALHLLARADDPDGWSTEDTTASLQALQTLGLSFTGRSAEGWGVADLIQSDNADTEVFTGWPHVLWGTEIWQAVADEASSPLARLLDSAAVARLMTEEPRLLDAVLARLADLDAWTLPGWAGLPRQHGVPTPVCQLAIEAVAELDEGACWKMALAWLLHQMDEMATNEAFPLLPQDMVPTHEPDSAWSSWWNATTDGALRCARLRGLTLAMAGQALTTWREEARCWMSSAGSALVLAMRPQATPGDKPPRDDRPTIDLFQQADVEAYCAWAKTRRDMGVLTTWVKRLTQPEDHDFVAPKRRLAQARQALDGLAQLREGFPHFSDILDFLDNHLALESVGEGAFHLPPLLMAGPPGTGKTFFFQELAALVATSYHLLPMESISGGFAIVGLEANWSSGAPGFVFEALMKTGATANPIFLLDEIDKLPDSNQYPVGPSLLGLLEPHSAARFTDRCVILPIDARHINWVATANDLSKVSAPLLSRFQVLTVPNPDLPARMAMARHIYAALCRQNSWGKAFEAKLSEETLLTLSRPAGAARDLRKNLTSALAAAARAGRARVEPQDIPVSKDKVRAPWERALPEVRPVFAQPFHPSTAGVAAGALS